MKGASSPSSVYRVSLSSTCTSPSFPAFATPSPPSPVLSFLPVLYTPFSTWPSRRIHSRDTPPPSFFLFLSLLPPPFRFASSPSVLAPLCLWARAQTHGATSRFTSLGDMSFSTLVARVSPSHQPPPRHGANLKMERGGWPLSTKDATWLMDRVSFFFFLLLPSFFWKLPVFIGNREDPSRMPIFEWAWRSIWES